MLVVFTWVETSRQLHISRSIWRSTRCHQLCHAIAIDRGRKSVCRDESHRIPREIIDNPHSRNVANPEVIGGKPSCNQFSVGPGIPKIARRRLCLPVSLQLETSPVNVFMKFLTGNLKARVSRWTWGSLGAHCWAKLINAGLGEGYHPRTRASKWRWLHNWKRPLHPRFSLGDCNVWEPG